jgi:hypothetical protein
MIVSVPGRAAKSCGDDPAVRRTERDERAGDELAD